jgi:hypothetical protein
VNNFFSELFFFFGVLTMTLLVGYPFTLILTIEKLFTKMYLSFAFGFVAISVSGMISNVFLPSVFGFQTVVVGLLLAVLITEISSKKDFSFKFKEYYYTDFLLLLFTFFIAIILTYSFSQIIMWAESDATFHASIIRRIVEGIKVPLNLSPGYSDAQTYFLAYPKAFHFYAAFFVRIFNFDLIQSLKIIPIIIQVIIPFGIYVLIAEIYQSKEIALFSFLMTSLQFNHIFPLIFGLYPSMTSLFLILAILIFTTEDRSSNTKIHFIFFSILMILVYLVHKKYLLHAFLLGGWAQIWRSRKVNGPLFAKYFLITLSLSGMILLLFNRIGSPEFPNFIWEYVTKFVSIFIARWHLAFLALPGFFLLITRRNRRDWFVLGWFLLWLSLAFLSDINVFQLSLNIVRNYIEIYLPISILAGYALFAIVESSQNKKIITYLIVVSSFIAYPLIVGSIFFTYVPDWTLNLDDYNAIKSLEGKTGVVINVDNTGRWIYPVVGLEVTNPRGLPSLIGNNDLTIIINDPSSPDAIEIIESLKERYGDVYIFISQRSSDSIKYNLFGNIYSSINQEEFKMSEKYSVFYEEEGSVILKYMDYKGKKN